MRYTEARMSKIAAELLRDINKETIDWVDNYDAEEKEPSVLPAKFPNLLVNGATGIAVGMATNIPPHNLGEAIDATIAIMENPDITVPELMENYIKGPDFPTGAYIVGRGGILKAYETGRGSIVIRSKLDVEDMDNGKKRIIIRELPYQVNKADLVSKIAKLVRDKVIEGITSLSDESNRDGIKIIIEIRRDVQVDVILNQLYRLTSLQTTFGVNSVVLVNNKPMQLGIKDILNYYIEHQIEVINRRTLFDLNKAKDRAHILEGLKIALDNIDAVINTIRYSKDNQDAMVQLTTRFDLDEIQAKAILDMQFKRLTGLERDKIINELNNLLVTIADLEDILAKPERVIEIIKEELLDIKARFNDDRRTEIIEGDINVEDEDLIPVEDVIISMTVNGYIKRLPVETYRTQNRGGRGIKGISLNEDDIVDLNISMSTHDNLMLFTNLGKVYRIKGYQVPESSRNSKGIPVVNLLQLEDGEKVRALVSSNRDTDFEGYLFFVTKDGLCKRVESKEFESIRQTGKIAITLKDGDELVSVKKTDGHNQIIIGAANGKAVRFEEASVRAMGRTAGGVRGMNVDRSYVIGACTDRDGQYILVVSENGYGKMTPIDEYRITNRGGKGVKTININEKNGNLVGLRMVEGNEDCLIMTDDGIIIRISLDNVAIQGRATLGVRLIKPQPGAKVSTTTIVENDGEDEEDSLEDEE